MKHSLMSVKGVGQHTSYLIDPRRVLPPSHKKGDLVGMTYVYVRMCVCAYVCMCTEANRERENETVCVRLDLIAHQRTSHRGASCSPCCTCMCSWTDPSWRCTQRWHRTGWTGTGRAPGPWLRGIEVPVVGDGQFQHSMQRIQGGKRNVAADVKGYRVCKPLTDKSDRHGRTSSMSFVSQQSSNTITLWSTQLGLHSPVQVLP